MSTPVPRLIRAESTLFVREPVSLIFVFAFPALVTLVIGNSFEPTDPSFGGATPAEYYIAAYVGVVLAAVGLVMIPAHLAAYRHDGVLRRFHASGFPPWALPVAWTAVATGLSLAGIAALLLTAELAFGVPAVEDPPGTALAVLVSTATFINIGLMLGLLLPSARAAQGVGMGLFFVFFLLGGSGPPPSVMPEVMRDVAQGVPTTHVVQALQHTWLGIGPGAGTHLVVLALCGVASLAGWIALARRQATR